MSTFNRPSAISSTTTTSRPSTKSGDKQAIWVPMLHSASKGKDLVEKQLVLLGGTPIQQREFLEQLNPDTQRARYGNDRKKSKTVPVSNLYALGYTYQDVLDADQEDVLARLNIYLLANPSAIFAPLLKARFSADTVKDTLIVILLDWAEPSKWARQLRQWIKFLRSVIVSLDDESKIAMEECMNSWKERRRGTDGSQPQMPISLGQGEWDEGLGMPLAVVCSQSEKMEIVERDQRWHEEHFDFLQQWLRTVLLKHGASLVYTASYDSNNVRALLHSSLNIQSMLKREVVKHNVIDRDKILVPPNWDSWGKIRILKEGFDPEAVGDAWSIEIQEQAEDDFDISQQEPYTKADGSSAVSMFAANLPMPLWAPAKSKAKENVSAMPLQEFLAQQQVILDQLKAEDAKNEAKNKKAGLPQLYETNTADVSDTGSSQRMAEQIGPYQINVNGIDFDAEEATRRLRERETLRREEAGRTTSGGGNTPTRRKVEEESGTPKPSNEAMSAFFANLIKKGGGRDRGTPSGGSPTRGSPAPERQRERE